MCVMPKQPKVLPINERSLTRKPRTVAVDTVGRRVLIAVGRQRIAIDYSATVTELRPGVGDAPAPVLPIREGDDTRSTVSDGHLTTIPSNNDSSRTSKPEGSAQ